MKPLFITKVSNVVAWLGAFEALRSRGASESCMMLVDGEPGLGKTRTATWWGTQHQACHVRAKQGWTQSWCLQDLYHAATNKPAPYRNSAPLFRAVADALTTLQANAARAGRPAALVIDEADHAVGGGKAVLETIRDLTDLLEIPTVLVGMDRVDRQLGRYPQVASRISQKVRFQPLNRDDVQAVIAGVCEVQVKEDLVAFAHRSSAGYTRELKEAIASIERFGQRNAGKAVGVEDMRGQVLLHDRKSGKPIVVS
jgi:DNA transposition AAA+ family ATPase